MSLKANEALCFIQSNLSIVMKICSYCAFPTKQINDRQRDNMVQIELLETIIEKGFRHRETLTHLILIPYQTHGKLVYRKLQAYC